MDCGFYPMSGSYFFANLGSSGRIDSRIQSVFGPIIHFDTEMIVQQVLGVIVEESLHYLQQYYQMPPELREKTKQVGQEIGISHNGERADTESACTTPGKGSTNPSPHLTVPDSSAGNTLLLANLPQR